MKKPLSILYTPLFLILSSVVCALTVGIVLIQTQGFQDYLINILKTETEKKGIRLEIKGLSAMGPFKWSLEEGSILWESGDKVELENIRLRIAILPLLKKQLSFTSLKVENASYFFSTNQPSILTLPEITTLPFSFYVKNLKIKQLLLNNSTTHKRLLLSLNGNLNIKNALEEVQLEILLKQLSEKNSIKIQVQSSKKKESILGNTQIDIEDSLSIVNFFNLPLKTKLNAFIRCRGKWIFWKELQTQASKTPLYFTIEGHLNDFELSALPLIEKNWSLHSDYTLWPDRSSSIENLSIDSSEFKLLGKASFSSSFKPLTAYLVASVKNISHLTTSPLFDLQGDVEAKLGLSAQAFLFSAKSSSLEIGKEKFTPANLKIEALNEQDNWKGTLSGRLENTNLTWESFFAFNIKNNLVNINNLSIKTKETEISGEGFWDPTKNLSEGNFFILANNLKLFRSLFPNSDLEGKLGGRLSLTLEKENAELSTNLLFRNIRYQSSILDSLRIEATIHDLLHAAKGSFSLDATNILVKGGEISKLLLTSKEENSDWKSFTVTASGKWKEPFYLSSFGLWNNENKKIQISCKEWKGFLFKNDFKADPFLLSYNGNKLALDTLQIEVGNGSLLLKGSLSKEEADIETTASHLPLDIVSLFYPNISTYGNVSFQGAFKGTEETITGEFLATLEEIDFLEKMKGKGSLQIHLTPLHSQIHAHLYATQNQFIDCSATIPLNFTYLPFKATIDSNKPFSGEIRLQGAIEEILDFLQTASQKASGWITGHLFASGNIKKPFIQGKIDLEKGSYENYISGTRLKNIDASLEAKGSSIDLVHFQAFDLKEGSAQGVGKLFLDKEKKYPFEANLGLHKLCLMQSDTLEATATGDVVFSGNLLSAKALGNLEIEQTTFTISDNLQMEIPSIPITYINKPIHLQRSEINLPSTYPINLELSIKAKNTVFIKGKGLDSEWQGDILLTGTPFTPIGKGSLTLKKGEFIFSGKTFTLMHGDISFSDKASQNAYLKLSGQLQLSEATITATMQGPLTAPKLTFQSTPALPTSSILSLILFNKDISEISPLQTLSLAQVIMSLSGNGGPDVLEAIRKSIGIDRLTIAGKDGSDEIALQIGWYLTHGVTVSLSQSATSSDVTVEVDLKHGFVFEAETQNQEEGKFSLKWNRNY